MSTGDRHLVAGALLAAVEPDRRAGVLDIVWTGPASNIATSRLTSAVVVDLIGQARIDVLLIGFAVHTEPSITAALHAAQERGVEITLLLERHTDNPAFAGSGSAFPDLIAIRLAWRRRVGRKVLRCTQRCWLSTAPLRSSAAPM